MTDLAVSYVPPSELRTYHRNPRKGNTAVIATSLKANNQYRPIVVNAGTHTGRANEVLAGNHTLMAIRDLGWDRVAIVTVDVDEDQAARIVAADNRTADLAEYDERLLLELLAELPDLYGTGYDPGDFADLEAKLAEPDFDPIDEIVRLDKQSMCKCPNCGHEFIPHTYTVTDGERLEGSDDDGN